MVHPDADQVHGLKRITPENVFLPDLSRAFARDHATWLEWFARPQLHASVPDPVQVMFEVSRGAMQSAWTYYPLLTMGADHCLRTVETAVRLKAGAMGINAKRRRYEKLIDDLAARDIIAQADLERWHIGRDLRNLASHLEDQHIRHPTEAQGFLTVSAQLINSLFPA